MRVCARLSAVQRLKPQEAADAAEGRQQTARKRGRAKRLVPDNAHVWQQQSSVNTRARRVSTRPTAAGEWQHRQQHGIVQASDFDWEQYLSVRSGTAALNGHLFPHQHFMDRTLAQHIFRPGRSVRVQCSQNGANSTWVSARIGITLPFGQAVVEIPSTETTEQPLRNGRIIGMDSGGTRTEIVQLDMVELADSAEEDDDRGGAAATEEGAMEDDFRTILRERREWLSRPLHTFIQQGQFFELQEVPSSSSRSVLSSQNVPSSSCPVTEISSSTQTNHLRVHTVRIVGHRNGMVLVEQIDADGQGGRHELVHITSERCHSLGWTLAQNPSDNYSLVGGTDSGDTTAAVPRWIFTFRPLAKHRFQVGMLLEMLDPLNRLSFVPAYVSERVNSHYFKVRPIRDVQSLDALLRTSDHIVHCMSPGIFPVGWCFKNQIRLTFPQGLNQTDTSFSYAALRLKLCDLFVQHNNNNIINNNSIGCAASIVADVPPSTHEVQAVQQQQQHEHQGQQQLSSLDDALATTSAFFSAVVSLPTTTPMEFNFAPDSLFDLPKMVQKRLECVRYCEVQDADDPTLFYPGAIVRSHQHLIWVHVDRDECVHGPAQIYTTNSLKLFRCGTAKTAAATTATLSDATASLRYFTVPIRIPTTVNTSYSLVRTFTSQRTPVFLVRQKHFLSEMWLKADLWLPSIYLSANCFCGPFLVADKVNALPARYAPSPLPHAISTLVKDLLTCGVGGFGTRGIRELIDLVGADKASRAPLQMLLKLKYANRRVRFSVETCERAAQFPGWLRTLLIRLDACPNLLSLEKRDNCPLNCSAGFASSNFLSHAGHANTASLQSSQQQTNKLNQAAQQLRKVVQQQKKRKNGRNKKAKKLEEEAETEFVLRQPQPFPARREPSKRLSIAQPVVDDEDEEDDHDGHEEKGGEEPSGDDDGINDGGGGRAVKRSRRRRCRKTNDDDDEEDNGKGTSSTSHSSSVNSSQQKTETVSAVDDQPTTKQTQQRKCRSSSSSSSLTDSSADEQQQPPSPISSSSSSSTTKAAAVAIPPSSIAAAPPQTPPLPPQRWPTNEKQQHQPQHDVEGEPPNWGGGAGKKRRRQKQKEVKREHQNHSEDDVQWYDHQQQAWNASNQQQQQQHANGDPSAAVQHSSDVNVGHGGVQQQQYQQHYSTPMPFYTPYLYAAAAPPPHQYNPYAFFYAPVAAAPSAASSCPSSSSAAPPFLHHPPPPPPHVHLMPAPPPPPAMFAPPLSSTNAAAGTSTTTASTSNYNNNNGGGIGTPNFDCPTVDSNPSRWSADKLCQWLTEARLADCAQRLLNEEVDGASLLLFTPIHYHNLGLKLGPMVKLQQMVEYLRQFTFVDGCYAGQNQ